MWKTCFLFPRQKTQRYWKAKKIYEMHIMLSYSISKNRNTNKSSTTCWILIRHFFYNVLYFLLAIFGTFSSNRSAQTYFCLFRLCITCPQEKTPLHNIIWRYIILTYDMYLAKPIEIKIVSLFYACVTSHRNSTATGWEFDPVITIFLICINIRSTFLLSKNNFIILSVLYICRHHNMLQFLMSQISKVSNC